MRKPNKARRQFLESQLAVLKERFSECGERSRQLRAHLSETDRVSLSERGLAKIVIAVDEGVNAELLECFAKISRKQAEAAGLIKRILAGKSKDLYGKCSNCEKQIPKKRLEVVPWAEMCVPCQEAMKTTD